jgi:hypothetical protein
MCLTCVCSLSVRPQEPELLDPDPNFLEALCGRFVLFLMTSDFRCRKDTQYEVGQRYRGRDFAENESGQKAASCQAVVRTCLKGSTCPRPRCFVGR